MTQQIEDVIILDDRKHIFAAWSGERAPFRLTDVWLDDYPKGLSTGCYRGWHMALRIRNNLLTLDRLSIVGGDDLTPSLPPCDPPHVFGVPLRRSYHTYQTLKPHAKEWVTETGLTWDASANDVGKILNWTGHLLLGQRAFHYPRVPYFHPGFRYDRLIECGVIQGEIVSVDDRTILASNIQSDALEHLMGEGGSEGRKLVRYGMEIRMQHVFRGDYLNHDGLWPRFGPRLLTERGGYFESLQAIRV